MLDDLLERREHISEALKRLPPYATALGESVGSASGFMVNLSNAIPNNTQEAALRTSTSNRASFQIASLTSCAGSSPSA